MWVGVLFLGAWGWLFFVFFMGVFVARSKDGFKIINFYDMCQYVMITNLIYFSRLEMLLS